MYNYFIYKKFLPTLPHHIYRHFAPAILTYLLFCLSIITQILYFVLPVPKQILLNFNFTASGRFAWRSQFVLLCNAFKLLQPQNVLAAGSAGVVWKRQFCFSIAFDRKDKAEAITNRNQLGSNKFFIRSKAQLCAKCMSDSRQFAVDSCFCRS